MDRTRCRVWGLDRAFHAGQDSVERSHLPAARGTQGVRAGCKIHARLPGPKNPFVLFRIYTAYIFNRGHGSKFPAIIVAMKSSRALGEKCSPCSRISK